MTELLGTDYPIIQAGMIWASGWRLASAVSNRAGLGCVGAGSMYPEVLREHIRKCRAATSRPFGVNVPLLYPDIDQLMSVIAGRCADRFHFGGQSAYVDDPAQGKGITVVHGQQRKICTQSRRSGL